MKKAQGISRDRRGLIRIGNAVDPEMARVVGIGKLMRQSRPGLNGCIEFNGWRNEDGYGETSFQAETWRAHKLMYVLTYGPVPDDRVVMHSCDNPPCINPAHLKLGTRSENNRDCQAKGRHGYDPRIKTHCNRGHEYTPENTSICPRGWRRCKECLRTRWERERNPQPKPPLTRDQLRQQRYRLRKKQRLQQSSTR